jgi:hypothetical protein
VERAAHSAAQARHHANGTTPRPAHDSVALKQKKEVLEAAAHFVGTSSHTKFWGEAVAPSAAAKKLKAVKLGRDDQEEEEEEAVEKVSWAEMASGGEKVEGAGAGAGGEAGDGTGDGAGGGTEEVLIKIKQPPVQKIASKIPTPMEHKSRSIRGLTMLFEGKMEQRLLKIRYGGRRMLHATLDACYTPLYGRCLRAPCRYAVARCSHTMQSHDAFARCIRTMQSHDAFARCIHTMHSHDAVTRCIRTMQSHDAFARCIRAMQSHDAFARCSRAMLTLVHRTPSQAQG